MKFQLVPPDYHQCNLAEKAIQTCKYHFIGVMRGTAATFPVHIWCQAITQAERQLLLLQQSHVHPKVSAYSQVYGPHDYIAALFVPIVMETFVHDKPKRRVTFAEPCSKGYFVGTDFEHYRSWTIWMKDKRVTRISATVFHKHKYITNPRVTQEDHVRSTAGKLTAKIKGRMAAHLKKRLYYSWSDWVPFSSRDGNIKKTNHGPLQLHLQKHTNKVPFVLPQKV